MEAEDTVFDNPDADSEPGGYVNKDLEWIDYNEVWAYAISDDHLGAIIKFKPKALIFDFPAPMIASLVEALI
jgi:hypothetical protein